jgi:uncharacterized protein (TIGR00369 family)
MDSNERAARRRVTEWADPRIAIRAIAEKSGRDFLAGIRDGDIPAPPVAPLTLLELIEVAEGAVTFRLTPHESLYNPQGSVHGGILATALDSCMTCAVHSLLPQGRGCTTLEIKVNYIRPATEATGPLRAEGKAIHGGRRTATAEGRLIDAGGRLYAHGTTTCLIFEIGKEG